MSRIQTVFGRCQAAGRKALIAYSTVGAPDMATSEAAIAAMIEAGADIIELGVPFSDPTADGTVIQEAAQMALKHDTTLCDVLALAGRLRDRFPEAGLVIFSYYNVIFHLGGAEFARRAGEAGVDGVLVVDLPFEEHMELRPELEKNGLDWITLISPMTSPERAEMLLKEARGFVYYIMQLGVTGVRDALPEDAARHLEVLRRISPVPVAAGFGIADGNMAREAARHADGVIAGSALVKLQTHAPDPVAAVRKLTAELAAGVRG